ncbi:hypothetical protein BCV69DRAFT_294451 [Microstroma glucosiphilum]|uniref:Uncharacterized protein n=1 Tax=Pseudomicrostroma glucosiphilum TaxID=1684307 RepID=A0A316U391_9BASI|nr:hypothetical protein BCV69DRAFT_294451 [Pseudomicrostroma glucosiphilum]PWN19717.1 hypothetical protein BCV69DRAFT_294451 [Pseudomicrostroma glucosiphilum]
MRVSSSASQIRVCRCVCMQVGRWGKRSDLLLASLLPPSSVSALLQVIALAIPTHRPSALTLSLASGFTSVLLLCSRSLLSLPLSLSPLWFRFLTPHHPHHLHIFLALAIHPYLALIFLDLFTDLTILRSANETTKASLGKAQ